MYYGPDEERRKRLRALFERYESACAELNQAREEQAKATSPERAASLGAQVKSLFERAQRCEQLAIAAQGELPEYQGT